MGMTEKQGGSDVRSNTTRADPVGSDGSEYLLTGHKWFCSAPMCDVFLVLAQAPGGLTCFVVPRVLPDGGRNTFRLQRLKDKLGNRSNASSEVELDGTVARRLGEEGRGVRTIIEMVAATRLDCVLGSTALMRQAVAQATHHAAHRSAFGGAAGRQAADAERARRPRGRARGGHRARPPAGRAPSTSGERDFRRLAVAVGKYWVCKRAPAVVAEALECLGGNGYVEESGLPRLYREAPLNSIWEGSGNVNALDVLRALTREPATVEAFQAEVALARGADRRLDAAADRLGKDLVGRRTRGAARRLVESMALVLQGSLLVRHSPAYVADAFCASRLAGDHGDRGLAAGTLPGGLDTALGRAARDPRGPLSGGPGWWDQGGIVPARVTLCSHDLHRCASRRTAPRGLRPRVERGLYARLTRRPCSSGARSRRLLTDRISAALPAYGRRAPSWRATAWQPPRNHPPPVEAPTIMLDTVARASGRSATSSR